MVINESDSPLIGVLQDIEFFLDRLPAAELRIFDQGWQALTAYVEQPGSTQSGMLRQLHQLLTASPTLYGQDLHVVVAGVSRYTPRPDEPAPANDGLAPVRNEVVVAIHQLGSTIRQQVAQLPSQ